MLCGDTTVNMTALPVPLASRSEQCNDSSRRSEEEAQMSKSTTVEFAPDVTVRERGYRIGAIGAGMIMADVHLEAYRQAGFTVTAIASRTESKARELAERYGIPTVH